MKKKEKKASVLFINIIFAALSGLGAWLYFTGSQETGNIMLILLGIIEIVIAVIGIRRVTKGQKLTCPECGTRREHHRQYIRTSEKDSNTQYIYKRTYTHHYLDTYTCPECGEEYSEQVQKSGGYYQVYHSTGRIDDKATPPQEF